MKKIIFLIIFLSVSFWTWADDSLPTLELKSNDRILIIAPHPDDETIGAGGIIQQAVRLNIPVHVAYLTNGDSNPLAFSLYKKRPVIGKRQVLAMGELRQKEAMAATGHLGLHEDQLIFLGYPDYGTLSIFRKFWQAKKPYRSALTRTSSVPYALSLTPGALYQAESIVSDFKKVLREVKPTKVFVTDPADENADHQAAWLFAQVALWDLQQELGDVAVYTFLVHAPGWPRPLGFYPDQQLNVDGHMPLRKWWNFQLTSQERKGKKEAVDYYRTQIPYKPKFLYSFVRANELFALHQEEQLKANSHRIERSRQIFLGPVIYSLEPDGLVVKIKLNQWSRLGFDINLYVFGYKKDVPFKDMPKYRLQIVNDRQAIVFDGQQRVRIHGIKVSRRGNDVVVTIPLALMHNPDKVLSSMVVRVGNWPTEFSRWTAMRLNDAR